MAVPAGVDLAGLYVELSYVDAVGERQRCPLVDCATARFEDVGPVRPRRQTCSTTYRQEALHLRKQAPLGIEISPALQSHSIRSP